MQKCRNTDLVHVVDLSSESEKNFAAQTVPVPGQVGSRNKIRIFFIFLLGLITRKRTQKECSRPEMVGIDLSSALTCSSNKGKQEKMAKNRNLALEKRKSQTKIYRGIFSALKEQIKKDPESVLAPYDSYIRQTLILIKMRLTLVNNLERSALSFKNDLDGQQCLRHCEEVDKSWNEEIQEELPSHVRKYIIENCQFKGELEDKSNLLFKSISSSRPGSANLFTVKEDDHKEPERSKSMCDMY